MNNRFSSALHTAHLHRRYADTQGYEFSHYARVTSITPIGEKVHLYRLVLEDEAARKRFLFRPGQFVLLEVPGIGEAPFTIASNPAQCGEMEFCIREVGTLSSFLARIGPTTQVGISGPFGTAFPLEEMRGCDVLFIAGGLGFIALRSALLSILGHRSDYGDVTLLYGAGAPKGLLLQDEFPLLNSVGITVECVVDRADENWFGPMGNVTVLLKERLAAIMARPKTSFALVCGPPVMFIAVCDMLVGAGLPPHHIFVSLERRMHCGRGKCCRCNIGSTYTCIDGPVFSYWSIMNLKEAI